MSVFIIMEDRNDDGHYDIMDNHFYTSREKAEAVKADLLEEMNKPRSYEDYVAPRETLNASARKRNENIEEWKAANPELASNKTKWAVKSRFDRSIPTPYPVSQLPIMSREEWERQNSYTTTVRESRYLVTELTSE